MHSYGWILGVAVGLLGLMPWAVSPQPPLDVWWALPGASDGTPTREISGAAALDHPDGAVLVSDEDASHLYAHNLAAGTITRLPFTADEASQIDDLEGLTRRPSDGMYFMMDLQEGSCDMT
jgi:hypothetical protein